MARDVDGERIRIVLDENDDGVLEFADVVGIGGQGDVEGFADSKKEGLRHDGEDFASVVFEVETDFCWELTAVGEVEFVGRSVQQSNSSIVVVARSVQDGTIRCDIVQRHGILLLVERRNSTIIIIIIIINLIR